MNVMKSAHTLRKLNILNTKGLPYSEQMSICLKHVYSQNRMKETARKNLAASAARFKANYERKISVSNQKEFSELDIAKAAFHQDNADRERGLKVLAW